MITPLYSEVIDAYDSMIKAESLRSDQLAYVVGC